jgi:5-methylcytosine-specific restriction protein A
MPTAPKRTCSGSPTCRTLVTKGSCTACARKRDQLRGSRHKRGYDAAWVAVTKEFWADPKNKYCACCTRRGLRELATEVDHVVPFEGKDDPRRLDRRNLQGLCGVCHRQKTAAQQRGVVWNGEMDRRGLCPSLVDGAVPRPSTLNRSSWEPIR